MSPVAAATLFRSRATGIRTVARSIGRVGLAGLLVLLASCGGSSNNNSGESVAPGDVDHRYPLEVGNRWVYQQTQDGVSKLVLDAVAETRQVQGESAVLVQRRDIATGAVTDETLRTSNANGVFELSDPPGGLGGDSRVQLLRFPLTAGATFTAQDKADLDSGIDSDGDGRTERVSQRIDVTVDGPESVSVPAGAFADATRVRTVVRRVITLSASQSQQTGTITYIDWYAAGVGPVKTTEVSDLPGNAYSSASQLTAYRIGTRTGTAASPALAAMVPADGSVTTTTAWADGVAVTFDGVLDPASGANGITVQGADGQAVAGQTVGSYTGLRFSPSTPLPPGRYTVTVNSTVKDITGTSLPNLPARSFTLQAPPPVPVAPALVSSTPASGGTQVAPGTAVTLNFSAALEAASVTPAAFAVSAGTDANPTDVPVDAVTLVSPTQVRLSFSQDYRQSYTVSVRSALKGVDGTAVTAAQVSFSMTSVDFGAATFYTAMTFHPPSDLEMDGNPYRALMADLDGRGRLSLILAMNPFLDHSGHHLSIYPPLNGRSLGLPLTVPVSGDTTCALWDLATANLRNDGKAAILVGRGRCGITLFERDGSGAWIQTDTVSMGSLADTRFSVGDLNGDGLPDLAALGVIGTGSYTLSVRYQQPGGGFGSLVTASSGQRDVMRMSVGDVNGDGRADLVLLARSNNGTGTSVGVLIQGADGTLGAEVVLPALPAMGTVNSVTLALGDINGDGRQDIVVLGGDAAGASLITYTQGADGQMQAPSVMMAPTPNPAGLVLADMEGDGRTDIVVGYARQAVIDVFHQMPTGGLRRESVPITLPYAGGLPDSVSDPFCLGDLDGDGRPDLLISSMMQAIMSIRYQPAVPSSATVVPAGAPGRSATALSRIPGRTFGLSMR